ncbi:MAG: GNAT family N-acetyltransferase [Chlorogloeopsis fritschii C42_A2020_084]|uniref:GNAT family N-acetyltransferase n=1 Tax=Chlorogloeopsis fritschii TaxID=1124 RepID=UPI0019DBCA1C|nr:GNAT family N-acetyltransferase [Chlorogloeopsis fritschii]MBF2008342.1 GNAT family N-acetyltransferase [Chlorogloeopsis fritschii C42_A2020_084]
MEINFKFADSSDTETLIQFIQEFYEYEGLKYDETIIRAALAGILKDGSLGRVWLIQQDNQAVGYIVLTFGYSLEYRGRDAMIDEFSIRETYRGQGVGKKTIQFIENVCQDLGIHAVHLEVERENQKAQNLYRQAGFTDKNRYFLTKWIIP